MSGYEQSEQLLFSANMSSEGLVVKMNPHGLVAIMVCGTAQSQRVSRCVSAGVRNHQRPALQRQLEDQDVQAASERSDQQLCA